MKRALLLTLAALIVAPAYGATRIEIDDGPSADAFGRLRTSGTGNRIDVEFIYNKQEEFFDEIIGGGGSVTWNSASRDLTIAISDTNSNTSGEMRSHPVPYTPGNSQLIEMTGALDAAALGGGSAEVFLRSTVTGTTTEETVSQSAWITQPGVDWSKSQIFVIDFQSLKTGRIRYGLNMGGQYVPVAKIGNDNKRTSGFWQLPSLPVFWRLYNDGTNTIAELGYGDDLNAVGYRYTHSGHDTNATLRAICCTVKSEGGAALQDLPGLPRSANMGVTEKTVSTVALPILSIRPKAQFQGVTNMAIVLPKSLTVTTDAPIRFDVVHDATLVGASWTDVDTSLSCMEYDTSATNMTGGHVVYSDYIAVAGGNAAADKQGLLGKTVLWHRRGSNGETGIFTLRAIKTAASDADVLGAINWEEIK